jgi:hypothetical protein
MEALLQMNEKGVRKLITKMFERYRFLSWVYLHGDNIDPKDPEIKGYVHFCKQVEKAVESLPKPEQEIIRLRYMQDDYVKDGDLAKNFKFSGPVYERKRNFAMYKLAIHFAPMLKDFMKKEQKQKTH